MSINEFLKQFKKNKAAKRSVACVVVVLLFGIYAPLFASSKPLLVIANRQFFFPLWSHLFDKSFFTHKLDLFFNLLMFTLPLTVFFTVIFRRRRKKVWGVMALLQVLLFMGVCSPSFNVRGSFQSSIAQEATVVIQPLLVQKHWQENALDQHSDSLLKAVRVNGKSLWAALLFGIRYSLATAALSVALTFLIGTTLGAIAGYYGGKSDLFIGRLIEVWEALPTFFVLLLIASFSGGMNFITLIVALALFSWTSIARVVRLEILKQKSMSYIEVLQGMGYRPSLILLRHVLPNSYPSLITLAPFALISAIIIESALSFLGVGHIESCSIGQLIDEARRLYPLEPSLFWPPALFLIILLLSLTYLGDLLKKMLQHKQRVI